MRARGGKTLFQHSFASIEAGECTCARAPDGGLGFSSCGDVDKFSNSGESQRMEIQDFSVARRKYRMRIRFGYLGFVKVAVYRTIFLVRYLIILSIPFG